MKKITIITLIIMSIIPFKSLDAQSYSQLWEQVDKNIEERLPESATIVLDQIEKLSIEENNTVQQLKTVIYRTKIFSIKGENSCEESITYIENYLYKMPEPAKAILNIALAQLYASYSDNNQYKIKDNQLIEDENTTDNIKFWSQNIFDKKIAEHYRFALNNPDLLKNTSTEEYLPVFENKKNQLKLNFEPTLYDYVLHKNVDYHYDMMIKDIDPKSITTNFWWLLADEFIKYNLPETDSHILNFLRYYQDLLTFDIENKYDKAFIYNELTRLGKNHSALGEKETYDLYYNALENLKNKNHTNPIKSKIISLQVEVLMNQAELEDSSYLMNYAKALKMCEEAIALAPKSEGSKVCQGFKSQILSKNVTIDMQNVVIPNQPIPVGLKYRNITEFSYRIYKVTEADLETYRNSEDEHLKMTLFAKTALIDSTLKISFEEDYREHSSLIALPKLEAGIYYILISENGEFSDTEKVKLHYFQVSNLSFTYNNTPEGLKLYVFNRETGQPMKNVEALFYQREYDYHISKYVKKELGKKITDDDGSLLVDFKKKNNDYFYVNLSFNGDCLLSVNYLSNYTYSENTKLIETTYFYTDRAIYRPGQTVYYKGIVVRKNSKVRDLVVNKTTKVIFCDYNWQEISKTTHTTDEFGAFDGSFVIPNDLMNGNYNINNENGSVSFRVEEYKRPTFEVVIDKPTDSYKLNENIEVKGSVMAYSGFGLDNVEYKYKVIRETNFPFCFWWWDLPSIDDEQIASGDGITDEYGKFKINFDLIPATGVLAKWQPLFTYKVSIEATSKQGETQHESYSLSAGYNEVIINTNLPASLEKNNVNDYSITVSNLSGSPSSTKMSRKFYKLTDNQRFDSEFDLGEFDRQLLTETELKLIFPNFDFYAKSGLEREKTLVYEDVITVNDKDNLFPEKLKNIMTGRYILELQSLDDKLAVNYQEFTVFDLSSKKMPYQSMCWSHLDKTTAQPGEVVNFYIGTSTKNTPVLINVKNGDKVIYDKCISLNNEVFKLPIKITEENRGQISFQAIFVRYNVNNYINKTLSVPYDNYKLDVKLNSERSVMLPGSEETWSVTIRDYKNNPALASLLAGMYDASLDVFEANEWNFNVLPSYIAASRFYFDGSFNSFSLDATATPDYYYSPNEINIPSNQKLIPFFEFFTNRRYYMSFTKNITYSTSMIEDNVMYEMGESVEEDSTTSDESFEEEDNNKNVKTLRENFNETAFFYPNLKTNEDGSVTFSFTMPDALTRWNLIMLAYTKDFKVGKYSQSFTTSKPLMIMADMPRFCYEEDTLWLVANVINTGETDCAPIAKLEIFDATSMNPINLILSPAEVQMQNIPSNRSQSVRWKVAFKKDLNLLAFRFSASTDNFSDAEQRLLPILSNEIFMTQTLPITVNSNSQEEIIFNELIANNKDERNYNLTLNFSTNPVWYAVQSLPYLADETGKHAEVAFYQFYANSLASYIAKNIPNLLNYIKKWQINTPDALMSQLEKDENLKAIMLQETPWVMDAKSESEQRARIANLFDINAMNNKTNDALKLIKDKQKTSGGWTWFDGMPESELITQYILSGFGKLDKMGVINSLNDNQKQMISNITKNAFVFIMNDVVAYYKDLDKKVKKNYHVSSFIINEMYTLSLFPDHKTTKDYDEAKDFFLNKLTNDWTNFGYETQAKAALVFYHNDNVNYAKKIIQSLRECSIKDFDSETKKTTLGMYWTRGAGLYFTPRVSDQAQIMEAFAEIDPQPNELDMMRVWLLTQKRTNKWENTRSSADAIYALLMNGNDWLNDNQDVTITIGNETISTENAEAGTGFIQKNWNASQINASMSALNINNPTNHLVWGGLFRQYFVPIDKVKSANNLMTIKRELYIEKNGDKGTYLVPIKDENLKVGDKVVVQIIFENTQDMEFVFLKDLHAASLEPIEQMSEYHYDDGMNYYQSITDTFTGYYFDYLLKGIHKVSYEMYVTKEGSFSNGYALIQCLYAPEFSAYSKGLRIEVK